MKQYERLLYQANKAPSRLALLFLIFNTWQTIFTLNMIDVAASGIRVMEIVLLNILLSFLVFIAASEIKRYSGKWSWAGLGIGVLQCARILFVPAGRPETRLNIAVSLAAAGLVMITASLWSLDKCGKYRLAKAQRE